eukprot:RCo019809
MGTTCTRCAHILPHNGPSSAHSYRESDSAGSGSSHGSHPVERAVPITVKAAPPTHASTIVVVGGETLGKPKTLSTAGRLQLKVASIFVEEEDEIENAGCPENDIPAIVLPPQQCTSPPGRRSVEKQETGRTQFSCSEPTDRTRLSDSTSRLSPTCRVTSQRARRSVSAYQHIFDEVRAGLQPAPEKPVDPRWRSLLPFQPMCLRHQVLTVNKDCTQIEGAIAFVDISGFSALANALANQGAKGAMLMSKYIN